MFIGVTYFLLLFYSSDIKKKGGIQMRNQTATRRRGTYLSSSRCNGSGDFQLQMAWSDEPDEDVDAVEDEGVYAIAHRAIDFAQSGRENVKDLQFRETLNLVFNDTVWLRGRGHGIWYVHGWAGHPSAIHGLATAVSK